MKVIRYTIFNAVFAACIYYGFFRGIGGAYNIAMFLAWFAIVLSPFLLSTTMVKLVAAKDSTFPVIPRWIDIAFDVCVLAAMLWTGHIATAIGYAFHIFAGIVFCEKIKEVRNNQKEAETNE